MRNLPTLKIGMIFGVVCSWSNKAMEDGEITLTAAAELATDLGAHLEVPVRIEADLDRRVEDLQEEPPETENPTLDHIDRAEAATRPPPR